MTSLPEKSSRRRFTDSDLSDDTPTRIVLGDDPSQFAESHDSTVELVAPRHRHGVSAVVIADSEKTIISKRSLVEGAPPAIHVGPLESRKSLEGETLDHYELEKFVGGGGMGAVYRSQDTRLGRTVAVKILSRDQSDSETVRRFRNEAQSAARLDHPNIARVYYIGEDKGWNFIVFEFIEGTNLREIVEKEGPLPFAEALDITLQIAEALNHAAARDVVHRDIKPSNILVTSDGNAKLVDMGLARLHQVESSADDLTQSGVTLGTFDYISPEQARDPRLADVRSDIYSLGCTLYFLLVGRPPFPEGTALQKLLRHNGDDPPDVRLFRPDTPDDVVAILQRTLAKKPDQRFQSPAEMIAEIHRVGQRLNMNLGLSSPRLTVTWPERDPAQIAWWRSLLPLAVAVALLFGLAVIPDGWTNRQPKELQLPAIVPRANFLSENVKSHADPSSAAIRREVNAKTWTSPGTFGEDLPFNLGETLPKSEARSPEIVGTEPPTATPVSVKPAVEQVGTAVASDRSGNESIGVQSPATTTGNTKIGESNTSEKTISPLDTMPRIDLPTMGEGSPVVKRRLVVGNEATPLQDHGSLLMPTLHDAIRYASQHSEIEAIDLAFNGKQLVSGPLDITSKALSIKASAGFMPELMFRPSRDFASADRRLIRLTVPGGSMHWEGVRLRLEVPSDADWSLFQLSSDSSLTIDSSVLTIASAPSVATQPGALSMVEIIGERLAMRDENSRAELRDTPGPVLRVTVSRSVMRGDATMFRFAHDSPLQLQITDSFISTNRLLLQSPGLSERPQWMERMRIALERSTIHAEAGLLLLGTSSDFPYRIEVRVDQQDCAVITARQSALVEYASGDAVEKPRITFEGQDNYYPRSEVFFRHRFRHDGLETKAEALFGELPGWAVDRNANKGTLVNSVVSAPPSDQNASEFSVLGPMGQPAGCALARLPSDAPTRPAAGTDMETMKLNPRLDAMPPMMAE